MYLKTASRVICIVLTFSLGLTPALGCTGISLKSGDGAVVVSRTVEWALSDARHDSLVLFPRNHLYT
ncbi:MAG: hypothetical protein ACK5VR_01820, partial [Burkholderiales bacterium]